MSESEGRGREQSGTGEPLILPNDAFGTLVAICSALLLLLASSVAVLYLWKGEEGLTLGGPSPALVSWDWEYKEMTGIDDVGNLDGRGVVVCMVDSGIDLGHPDLDHLQLMGWKDSVNQLEQPYDDEGHGTAMAGIIVANGGLKGVSRGVGLLVSKAIDDEGVGSDQTVSESVDWCVEEGADVISLSLGGEQGFGSGIFTTDGLEQSVEDAMDKGVFVVAAAGNDGEDDDGDVESPGSVEDVICVGGISRNGDIWSGSSKGDNNGRFWPNPILPREDPDKKPEIVAPGQEVPVLMIGGSSGNSWWGWSSGTSASTAWVSGALALLLEHDESLQRENSEGRVAIQSVKQLIMEKSQMKEGESEHDDYYGYGVIRIDQLVGEGSDISGNSTHSEAGNLEKIYDSETHYSLFSSATRVPPVNSAKPSEWSVLTFFTSPIQRLNDSTFAWAGVGSSSSDGVPTSPVGTVGS
ncbi:MAG: S8 family serine peptidase [Candidatus Thalassarchaeum sp.]|nr:S8 family serine peptidase [Candidatus Thalassarchaeum sp.]